MDLFYIQASSPSAVESQDIDDESLEGALQTIFPLWNESILLCWNRWIVPLSYKDDLSWLMEDILDMLEALRSPAGVHRMVWSSDTFNGEWNLTWRVDDIVVVESNMESTAGPAELARHLSNRMTLNKHHFLAEWKRPLVIALHAVQKAGYSADTIRDFARLETTVASLPYEGILYCRHSRELAGLIVN